MAKVRSVLKLSGTVSEMTFVDSKAYGAHSRAKRGTYTPITLAEGMKASSTVQTEVNLMAKIIFDSVNAFIPGFKDGKFWSRLLSVFRKQKKISNRYSYHGFNLMEIRTDYPTSRHGSFRLTKPSDHELMLHYQLYKPEGYRLRILRIATDASFLHAYPMEVHSIDILNLTKMASVSFETSKLPDSTSSLYVVHCKALYKGGSSGALKDNCAIFLSMEGH